MTWLSHSLRICKKMLNNQPNQKLLQPSQPKRKLSRLNLKRKKPRRPRRKKLRRLKRKPLRRPRRRLLKRRRLMMKSQWMPPPSRLTPLLLQMLPKIPSLKLQSSTTKLLNLMRRKSIPTRTSTTQTQWDP